MTILAKEAVDLVGVTHDRSRAEGNVSAVDGILVGVMRLSLVSVEQDVQAVVQRIPVFEVVPYN